MMTRTTASNAQAVPFLAQHGSSTGPVRKKFIGIERDPVYFEYACQRIAQASEA